MTFDPRSPHAHQISRRKLLGVSAGLAAASTLAGSALAQSGTPEASPATDIPANGVQPDGSWVFTDDRGVTVTLPEPPTRVFADLSAAAPLWDFGVRPVGLSGFAVDNDLAWGNIDREIEVVHNQSAELDIERLISLAPDIFVSITWRPEEQQSAWGIADDVYAQVDAVAPIVCISATGDVDANILRFAELAGLLGADLESPENVAAKDAYDAAVEAFSTTAQASKLEVLFAYVTEADEWYAAGPGMWGDLNFYAQLGLPFAPVELGEGEYWLALSHEEAGRFPTDVFLNSTRGGCLTPEQLAADPLFSQHPAIAAGQIGGWNQDFITSYPGMTQALTYLTTLLQESEKLS